MRYLSSANIKAAAAEQPEPERTKNLLGSVIMPGLGGTIAFDTVEEVLEDVVGPLPARVIASIAANMGFKKLQDINAKKLPEILLKSPNDIKTAAMAQQPNPERQKNFLGDLMPYVGGIGTGYGAGQLGALAHRSALGLSLADLRHAARSGDIPHAIAKNPGLNMAVGLANIIGSVGMGYGVTQKLKNQPTNKLPEIFLKSPNDIKIAATVQVEPERTKNLLGKLMPLYGGVATTAGSALALDTLTGLALHLAKIKDPRAHLATILPNMIGSGVLGYTAGKRLKNIPTKSLPEIFLNSPNDIKIAAMAQVEPERTKNLLGELMPAVVGGATGVSVHAIGDLALREALHLGKFKDPRLAIALALGNILGSGALGYTAGKRVQNQPTNKLPEIFLNPKQTTK